MGELMSVARLKIQTQGEFPSDESAIENLVDEVINEFQQDGLITDDADVAVLRAEMIGRLQEESKTT